MPGHAAQVENTYLADSNGSLEVSAFICLRIKWIKYLPCALRKASSLWLPLPAYGRYRFPTAGVFMVFDSHPCQDHLNGARSAFSTSIDATAQYLDSLLAIDETILSDHNLGRQAQLLANFSGLLFVAKRPGSIQILSKLRELKLGRVPHPCSGSRGCRAQVPKHYIAE